MAEQEQPIRRRVALKIIKLGMDMRAVIARFEAERLGPERSAQSSLENDIPVEPEISISFKNLLNLRGWCV